MLVNDSMLDKCHSKSRIDNILVIYIEDLT